MAAGATLAAFVSHCVTATQRPLRHCACAEISHRLTTTAATCLAAAIADTAAIAAVATSAAVVVCR
jgi:ABC-type Co2+ transport system permease subunit